MEDLYQEIILEHNRQPRNFGPLAGATHRADGRNPLCGDELSIALRLDGGRIAELRFQGQGCAISKASASLMTEALVGKRTEEARACAERILTGLAPGGRALAFEEVGDLAALSGVRKFPARVKCATLAWHAFLGALDGRSHASTEGDG